MGTPFVLFDLGGVLIGNAGFERLGVLVPEAASTSMLKSRWLASPAVRRFELGLTDANTFARDFVAEWRTACSSDEFITEFETWPRDFFPGAKAMIARLRTRHRVGCLSNSNVLHWARYDGFAGLFDVTLSSHLLGLIKPDAACFDAAIDACGVPAGDIHFFDDSLPNVTAALERGINAWHVEGLIETEAALDAIGIDRDAAPSG